MNSHSNSRNSPTLGPCQRERHSGLPSAASALSAGQLLREGRLMRSAQELRVADHQSRITIHQPPVPHFLIASHQLLEIRVTSSQQTRKYFLIASFYRVLAHSRLLATPTSPASHRIFEVAPPRRRLPSAGRQRFTKITPRFTPFAH